uniref:Protein rolling stone n=1 Tax=Lygus hesperus TaxID=30085 RepID=A0A0A9WHY5_LYGHE
MSRFLKCCKRSIRDLGKFADKHEDVPPEEVVRSCWTSNTSRVSVGFLLYRWVQFFLHAVFEIISVLDVGRRYNPQFLSSLRVKKTARYYMKWLLYLTHWGLILNSVQAFMGVWLVQKAHDAQNRTSSEADNTTQVGPNRTLTKIYCYLWSVAFHLSSYITLGFWLLVFDSEVCGIDAVTLSEHGFGLILLLLDLFVSGVPYKMFSGVFTVLLSTFYLMVTYVHHLFHALDRFQDKPYIYEKGDWSNPVAVIIYYIFSIFVQISFHFSLWGLYLLRRRLTLAIRTPLVESSQNSTTEQRRPQLPT